MFTTKLRLALAAAATLCTASAAHAKPRRVVILDFDGPRSLADSGRSAIVSLLTEEYEISTKQKWEDARERASRGTFGPQTWNKAAKASGIDAVIEGWVADEGRHKVLNIVVREASTGREFDTLTFKLGKQGGFSGEAIGVVREGIDGVLAFIEPGIDPSPKRLPDIDVRGIGSKGKRKQVDADDKQADDDDKPSRKPSHKDEVEETDDDSDKADSTEKTERTAREKTETALAPDEIDRRDSNELKNYLGNQTDEWPLPKKPDHVPQDTPRVQIGFGGYYASRSLSVDSEDPQDFLGVTTKGISLNAAFYPFPLKKKDGVLSGIGFSASIYKAPESTVTVQGDDFVADYKINSGGFDAAVHYRYPISDLVSIDGHVGYAQEYFELEQDIEIDVPDVGYKYFWGGANVDLNITEGATVGFGAKYLYVTDNGQMSSLDWYGPGSASGYSLEGNFQIPLPKRLYVQGSVKYRRITTTFDAPDLSAEQAQSAADGTVNGSVHVGIRF